MKKRKNKLDTIIQLLFSINNRKKTMKIYIFLVAILMIINCSKEKETESKQQNVIISNNSNNQSEVSLKKITLLNKVNEARILNNSDRHVLFNEAIIFITDFFNQSQSFFEEIDGIKFRNMGFFHLISRLKDESDTTFMIYTTVYSKTNQIKDGNEPDFSIKPYKYKLDCIFYFEKINNKWEFTEIGS